MNNNIINIIYILFKMLNLPIKKAAIKRTFINHPFSPSLLSLADTLKKHEVDNLILQLDKNEFTRIIELPTPFIASLDKGGVEFIIIEKIIENKVYYTMVNSCKNIDTLTDFYTKWTGLALLPFPTLKELKKTDFVLLFQKILIISILILVIYYSFLLYSVSNSLVLSALLLIKLIGSIISVMLIKHEENSDDSLVKDTCAFIKSDCDNILSSNKSHLISILSWSEAGYIYFAGGILAIMLGVQRYDSLLIWLLLINIPTLLFSFYSIWHQKIISKKWCFFCITIIILFWIEFALLLSKNINLVFLNNIIGASYLLSGFLLSAFSLFFMLKSNKENTKIRQNLKKALGIKLNNHVFDFLRKDKLSRPPDESFIRIFGDDAAQNNITIVTSPNCLPCSKLHEDLNTLIEGNNFINLSVDILFYIDPDTESESEKYKVAITIISIFKSGDIEQTKQALQDWHIERSYSSWSKKYPLPDKKFDYIITNQNLWCKKYLITHTPTLIFNRKELPNYYELDDLPYMFNI